MFMGKYEKQAGRGMSGREAGGYALENIANELAEANRLKRYELKNTLFDKPTALPQDLKDQA